LHVLAAISRRLHAADVAIAGVAAVVGMLALDLFPRPAGLADVAS
jgi:hypothetical protein